MPPSDDFIADDDRKPGDFDVVVGAIAIVIEILKVGNAIAIGIDGLGAKMIRIVFVGLRPSAVLIGQFGVSATFERIGYAVAIAIGILEIGKRIAIAIDGFNGGIPLVARFDRVGNRIAIAVEVEVIVNAIAIGIATERIVFEVSAFVDVGYRIAIAIDKLLCQLARAIDTRSDAAVISRMARASPTLVDDYRAL